MSNSMMAMVPMALSRLMPCLSGGLFADAPPFLLTPVLKHARSGVTIMGDSHMPDNRKTDKRKEERPMRPAAPLYVLKNRYAALSRPAIGLGAAALASLCVSGGALAGEQFVDKNGVANFGYDVVAYHTDHQPTQGVEAFSATYNGVPFWFASAANRDLFLEDPTLFIPAYDGHCAFALVSHKKLTVDPEAFSIVDPLTLSLVDPANYEPGTGVLYLNYSPGVNEEFNADIAGNLEKADFAWDDCLETRPAARPGKGFRDFFGGRRPRDCPKAGG